MRQSAFPLLGVWTGSALQVHLALPTAVILLTSPRLLNNFGHRLPTSTQGQSAACCTCVCPAAAVLTSFAYKLETCGGGTGRDYISDFVCLPCAPSLGPVEAFKLRLGSSSCVQNNIIRKVVPHSRGALPRAEGRSPKTTGSRGQSAFNILGFPSSPNPISFMHYSFPNPDSATVDAHHWAAAFLIQ